MMDGPRYGHEVLPRSPGVIHSIIRITGVKSPVLRPSLSELNVYSVMILHRLGPTLGSVTLRIENW